MQETKYANARAVMEMVKLGAFSTEIGAAAKDTARTAKTDKEKAWARKLKCVNTYLNNILTERLEALDPEQLKSVERRARHTVVEIMSSDKARLEKEKDYETYEPNHNGGAGCVHAGGTHAYRVPDVSAGKICRGMPISGNHAQGMHSGFAGESGEWRVRIHGGQRA